MSFGIENKRTVYNSRPLFTLELNAPLKIVFHSKYCIGGNDELSTSVLVDGGYFEQDALRFLNLSNGLMLS